MERAVVSSSAWLGLLGCVTENVQAAVGAGSTKQPPPRKARPKSREEPVVATRTSECLVVNAARKHERERQSTACDKDPLAMKILGKHARTERDREECNERYDPQALAADAVLAMTADI